MTGRVWPRIRAAIDRRATPRVVLIAGYVVFLLYAYPGYLTVESADQLIDARVGAFTDWHAPVMSLVWRILELVVSGPVGMLVLQSGLALGGGYALLRRAMPARPAAIAASAVLVFPPVMVTLAVVVRDAQMAGFLLAGTAAVTSPRRAIRLGGLALLALACTMRDTAALAALPIAAFGFTWRERPGWRRAAIGAAAWLAAVVAARGLDAALVDAPSERDAVARATADIVGTLRYSPPLDDAELIGALGGAGLVVQSGIQASAAAAYRRGDTGGLIAPPATPGARDALFAARRALAVAHPGAYLATRWRVLYRTIGLSRSTRIEPVYTSFVGGPDNRIALGHQASHGRLQRIVITGVRYLRFSVVFQPSLYLALALVLLPLAVVRRQADAALLLASGVMHAVAVFVLGLVIEYRASHWTILCTVLAVVLMIARRIAGPDGDASA